MDPVIDNEWLSIKHDPVEETPVVGNVSRSWQWRELGANPPHYPASKTVLENAAEDILVQKPLKIRSCDLPGYPRSTFLMVFSPDGTKVASTHGNHNVYVSDLASGKHLKILEGHPRTPWCIAFHPSHTQLIGSGCLGGQVRVWDMGSGGSEVWNVRYETVIASIAFHPREQLLVIATYNELYFWDWSHPAPFTKVTTNNINEKVRYVAFDALGYKLITGISVSGCPSMSSTSLLQQSPTTGTSNTQNSSSNRRNATGNANENPLGINPPTDNAGSAQDMIVNSYQNLVQRYDSLVRNYQRLFMVRHRLSNSSQSTPNTIDRGTDPMETDTSPGTSGWSRPARPSTVTTNAEDGASTSGTRRPDSGESGDGENSSRLLNLDALTFDSDPSRNQDSVSERSPFGSRSSAFQPLNETGRTFRPSDPNERSTRLLPNPFSSPGGISRSARVNFGEMSTSGDNDPANASRTSIFTSSRMSSTAGRVLISHRRNFSPIRRGRISLWGDSPTSTESTPTPSPRNITNSSANEETQDTTAPRRPTMTNSSTQMSPVPPLDAEALNESLDLIRDILRDSGTRLLNLITDMSLSMVSASERERRRRAHSDEGSPVERRPRPRPRLLSVGWRRELLSSSSDSDSDRSLEPDALRARSTGFRDSVDAAAQSAASLLTNLPTDRLMFDILTDRNESAPRDNEGLDPTRSNDRFRVPGRDDEDVARVVPEPTPAASEPGPSEVDPQPSSSRTNPSPPFSRPSTSRDEFWTRGSSVSSEEAYRKVRNGVAALQKHTVHLANLWYRGNRISMRELRNLWENLRRRILALQRDIGRQDSPGYYTRSLLERCMMLADIAEPISRPPNRNLRRSMDSDRNGERTDHSSNVDMSSPNRGVAQDPSNSTNAREEVQTRAGRNTQTRSQHPGGRVTTARRRVQPGYRWQPEDERRRRSRNIATNRLAQRYSNRSRREFTRAIEISATKHELRMRAMQVLSVMFNMMMMCLEERGLSQLIIIMLRTLKKALVLSWFMVMTNRNSGRTGNGPTPPSQRTDPMDVVHIQNEDDANPVNVDDHEDTQVAENVVSNTEVVDNTQTIKEQTREQESRDATKASSSVVKSETPNNQQDQTRLPSQNYRSSRWSNRLAVQIAAANRNNSATALSRRELYIESKRLKALHRTNPSVHPLNKKRTGPPMSTYRIPTLRCFPRRPNMNRPNTPRSQETDPIPGPSNLLHPENSSQDPPRAEGMYEFYQRVNFIRIAHMQAVSLRNAARNRFRRLQTIRLYTPSSVREMFALYSNNPENPPENRPPPQSNPELGSRRQFAVYRPHILAQRIDPANASEEPPQFNSVANNAAPPPPPPPPAQAQDAQAQRDGQNAPTQRLPRIHEYLQPIILAQNAMVVEEEGGGPGGMGGARRLGGMAGLLDAGIISETMPASSHRVQAWDFTTGNVPELADGKKNVVVQRCRIHNDASIDISKDGRLLVALLPVPRMRNTNHWLGVYSLEWGRLGQCLHTAVLEQTAVSVALSPTARHLAVGLGSKRFTSTHRAHNHVFALLYKLDSLDSSSRTGLSPIKELEQNWEQGFTSLNCLRWAPQPGQGLVYANNAGQLIVMS